MVKIKYTPSPTDHRPTDHHFTYVRIAILANVEYNVISQHCVYFATGFVIMITCKCKISSHSCWWYFTCAQEAACQMHKWERCTSIYA